MDSRALPREYVIKMTTYKTLNSYNVHIPEIKLLLLYEFYIYLINHLYR